MKFDYGKYTRVGWVGKRPKKIICHAYYARDHISSQCLLKFFQLADVDNNYDNLTEEEKKTVADTSFENDKSYWAIKGEISKKTSENRPAD